MNTSKSLYSILDDWLVHDESCPTSWSGIDSDKCDCIANDQKRNLGSAIVEAVEGLADKVFPDGPISHHDAQILDRFSKAIKEWQDGVA